MELLELRDKVAQHQSLEIELISYRSREKEHQHLQQAVLRKCTELNQMRQRHKEQESPLSSPRLAMAERYHDERIQSPLSSPSLAERYHDQRIQSPSSPNAFSFSSPRLAIKAAALVSPTATTRSGAAPETSTTETRAPAPGEGEVRLAPDSGAEGRPQSAVPRISPYPLGGVVAR
jgi:hypothetical protein